MLLCLFSRYLCASEGTPTGNFSMLRLSTANGTALANMTFTYGSCEAFALTPDLVVVTVNNRIVDMSITLHGHPG
jgi:hypothetical protein